MLHKIKFDIIHCHWTYRAGFLGGLLAILFKKKLIITTQGSDINLWVNQAIKRNRILWALNKSDKIIAVSNALKQKMIDLGVTSFKIEVIRQGVDTCYFRPSDKRLVRKRLNLPLDKKIILCIADFFPVKGHETLLNSIKCMKKTVDRLFILIGDGPLRENIKQKIKDYQISELITLVGKKDHIDIPNWINASDIIVLPSNNEGYPTVINETFACGKPIVATNVGGIPEAIKEFYNGILVKKENCQELAKALDAAIENNWDSAKIVKSSQEFTWENISNKLYDKYKEILVDGDKKR